MNFIDFIDVLPSVSSIAAILGFVINRDGARILGAQLLLGGLALSLLAGLISVSVTKRQRKFGWARVVNASWVLLILAFIAFEYYSFSTVKWNF